MTGALQQIIDSWNTLGIFSILGNDWNRPCADPVTLAPQQLTIALSQISPPPPEVPESIPSSPIASPLASPILDLRETSPLLSFPEMPASVSPQSSIEPALRPLEPPALLSSPVPTPEVSMRVLRPKRPSQTKAAKAKRKSERKISPLPARARRLLSTNTTPDLTGLTLSTPPHASASLSPASCSSRTLSPVSSGCDSDITLVDESGDEKTDKHPHCHSHSHSHSHSGSHCHANADHDDSEDDDDDDYEPAVHALGFRCDFEAESCDDSDEYVIKQKTKRKLQAKNGGEVYCKSIKRSPRTTSGRSRKIATNYGVTFSKPRRPRTLATINIVDALDKKPLEERDEDEIMALFAMAGILVDGVLRYPCGFGCRKVDSVTGIDVGLLTLCRRADAHRHMNSCPLRPPNAPPPKLYACFLKCSRKEVFDRKDALRRHCQSRHENEYWTNENLFGECPSSILQFLHF